MKVNPSYDTDLSPFVMEELNKVTMDVNFNRNSYDIYSHLINTVDYESTDFVMSSSDNQNSHQFLIGAGGIDSENQKDNEGLFNQSENDTMNIKENSGDSNMCDVSNVSNDGDQAENKNDNIQVSEDGTKISITMTPTVQTIFKKLHPENGILPLGFKIPRKTSEPPLPTIQVINSHNLKRNDVVIKSILRSMKRYFKNRFLEITDYKKSMNSEPLVSPTNKCASKRVSNYVDLLKLDPINQQMVGYAHQVVTELSLPEKFENMEFYVLALAFPNETLKMLQDIKAKIKSNAAIIKLGLTSCKLVDNAMNRFSKKVFKSFMETPEISHMVQHFLTHNEDHLARIEGFSGCVEMIDHKSKEVIERFESSTN